MDNKNHTTLIEKLYCEVLENEKSEYSVVSTDIDQGMKDMSEAYSRNRLWRYESGAKIVDYNNASHRCAYLYKHAMIHTDLVCTELQAIFKKCTVKEYIDSRQSLKLCSLGGGPGTDIVALLIVIRQVFGVKECSATIVDYATGWEHMFEKVVSGLRGLADSDVSSMVDESRFDYRYLGADLLSASSLDETEVKEAISNADIITMVKFVSAAACNKTGNMLEKIFQTMKPGSLLLFIDSAGGGFDEMVESKVEKCGLETICGPLRHVLHLFENSYNTCHEYPRQHKARVTVAMWRQPLTNSKNPLSSESGEEPTVDESGDDSPSEYTKAISTDDEPFTEEESDEEHHNGEETTKDESGDDSSNEYTKKISADERKTKNGVTLIV